jgi:hypothetical protein
MAVTKEDCIKMTDASLRNNVIMAVGHVMRYLFYFNIYFYRKYYNFLDF